LSQSLLLLRADALSSRPTAWQNIDKVYLNLSKNVCMYVLESSVIFMFSI